MSKQIQQKYKNIKLTNMFSIPYNKHNPNTNTNNNNNKTQHTPQNQHKNIYQMHYIPKLTQQILADSDISESAGVSDDSRCRDSSRYQYILNKWGTAIRDNRNTHKEDRKTHSHFKHKIQIAQSTPDIASLAMKIRYGIQYFITSIGNEEIISPKLQFAIENLLLHMLNVANSLATIIPTPPKSMQTPTYGRSNEIQTIQKNYKDSNNNKDYYRDSYNQQQQQRSRNYTGNSMRIEDGEQEYEQENGYDQSVNNVIAEENSSREESMSGTSEVDVQAFTNSQRHSNMSRNSSNNSQQYCQNTTNQALLKFLNINPKITAQINSKPAQKYTAYHPKTSKPHHEVNQVEYEEGYTQNQSQIGVEEPSSTSIMLPDNFVKKYDYYSGSCQPLRPTHVHNEPRWQEVWKNQNNVQENSDIQCSISEYYIEQSPCGKPSNKKSNKQNKYPDTNSRYLSKDVDEGRNKYERSKYEDKSKLSKGKHDSRYEGFTYSEVVSRKKIF